MNPYKSHTGRIEPNSRVANKVRDFYVSKYYSSDALSAPEIFSYFFAFVEVDDQK